MSESDRYRLRSRSNGRERLLEADRRQIYLDRETGEPLEVVGRVLSAGAVHSRLPWAVENLRICPWCEQLAQKDLNDCPTCGRRMGPFGG